MGSAANDDTASWARRLGPVSISLRLEWEGKLCVAICPEYSLLPEHTFLVALDEVVDIYCSLVSGAASNLLGIVGDCVIVTGELAGGNLAVSLCVKLCMKLYGMHCHCHMIRDWHRKQSYSKNGTTKL